MAKSHRKTLTKGQIASSAGRALLDLLIKITDDGELTLGEIRELQAWLADNRQDTEDIPAISWLGDLVDSVLADGRVTVDERIELIVAIERVLPLDERCTAQVKRQLANEDRSISTSSAPITTDAEPATTRQLNFIKKLGGDPDKGLSKWQASDLIEELLENRPPTPRQRMWMRFWNVTSKDGGEIASRDLSEFMDEFYEKDLSHQRAWELWKRDHPEDNASNDPDRVPQGGAEEYLRLARQESDGSGKGCLAILVLLGSLFLCLLVATGI